MRPLLNWSMSCVREPSGDRLVVGLRPAIERTALFMLVLGLLLLGLPIALLTESLQDSMPQCEHS